MRKRKQRQLVWRHANETLEETCIRESRSQWKRRYQYLDPRMRRLKAVRDRRTYGGFTAVLCDCED